MNCVPTVHFPLTLKDKNIKKEFVVQNVFRFLFNNEKTFAYVIFITNCKQSWRGVRIMPVRFYAFGSCEQRDLRVRWPTIVCFIHFYQNICVKAQKKNIGCVLNFLITVEKFRDVVNIIFNVMVLKYRSKLIDCFIFIYECKFLFHYNGRRLRHMTKL